MGTEVLERLGRIRQSPERYLALAPKLVLQGMCGLFAGASFHLQGQMDLRPGSRWYSTDLVRQYGGYYVPGDPVKRGIADLDPWDSVRRDMLVLQLRGILVRGIPGELAELGVYRGVTARLIHHYMPERRLHLFDTFSGFDERDKASERGLTGVRPSLHHFADTSVMGVRRKIDSRNGNVRFHVGFFPNSIPPDLRDTRFAFVHLDADLYEPMIAGLRFFYERMPPGGVIVCHDYNAWLGARRAVDEFFAGKLEIPVPMPDKSGSAVVIKA
jgi:O-methyltransferase